MNGDLTAGVELVRVSVRLGAGGSWRFLWPNCGELPSAKGGSRRTLRRTFDNALASKYGT